MATQIEYAQRMLPWARRAAAETGLPVSVVLAQWGLETAWGTSDLARRHNNHGGIKYVAAPTQDGRSGAFASYRSLDRFLADYVRVLRLPYYRHVREAAAQSYASAADRARAVARALGDSPYDAGGYSLGGVRGAKLTAVLDAYPLVQFDAPAERMLPRIAVREVGDGRVEVTATPAAASSPQVLAWALLAGAAALLLGLGQPHEEEGG